MDIVSGRLFEVFSILSADFLDQKLYMQIMQQLSSYPGVFYSISELIAQRAVLKSPSFESCSTATWAAKGSPQRHCLEKYSTIAKGSVGVMMLLHDIHFHPKFELHTSQALTVSNLQVGITKTEETILCCFESLAHLATTDRQLHTSYLPKFLRCSKLSCPGIFATVVVYSTN